MIIEIEKELPTLKEPIRLKGLMNMTETKITKADIDSYRVMLGDKLYYEEVTRVYNINKMVDNMKKDFIEQRLETIKEEVIRKNKKGE